ncbi:MAG: hypothetical protein Q8T13_18810 [Acidobacteriota bacterium]|nr:hypothetical protein [Acidobacteriota bacterium]
MARSCWSRRRLRQFTLAALLSLAIPVAGFAQAGAPDLTQLSIEDLMRIEVTSVARKEQRAADVASAVYVITADDIRRSGQTAAQEPVSRTPSEAVGGHLLGRLTGTQGNGGAWQIQGFIDLANRDEPVAEFSRQTYDLDTQYQVTLGRRHDLVAGLGYRLAHEHFTGNSGFSLDPAVSTGWLLTGFVQDEVDFLDDRLSVTLGGARP